ncbi:MAG: short-chain dehydrogenase [Verrucomicrobia bacterium]|nr:MAG: short-chain dehydrogenase [Verrucomicrobia bacterium 13_2_20CM_55_10]OLB19709.1 MAG: short-chain dehydrogenase [Verrucomicrobia bacterium 13_2_20CM_2_54_15_9cls]PYI43022.1 MAG: short-chain dehydrogenase [Verrucomicrobiota bacterium]
MSGIQAHMKIALVTGANKGIGREVARQLAAKGFHVFIGARNRSAGRKAADEIAKKGGKTAFLEIDVSDNNSVAVAAREFVKTSDHLDVLVNNAGIIVDGDHAILEIGDELLRKTLETNTLGALRVIRAFVPLLAKSKAPRVINVSSGGGQLTGGADGWSPAYCISKTALNGVTSQLAAALPKFAINSVCPGWVRTDMGGRSATRSVEEGADTIVWLASEAPQDLTGKFLRDRKEIPW